MPREPLVHQVRDADFLNVNTSRHDKFHAKAPRTSSGKRYRVQLVLLRTTRVRNDAFGSLVERYLQRAKLLLDEHDLDLRVKDLLDGGDGGNALTYDVALRDPRDPSSGDLRPNIADDLADLLRQTSGAMTGLLNGAGVPQDDSWLPVVFTPFDHTVRGVCPQGAGACFVDSEAPGPDADFGTVLHEVAHASGLPNHTNQRKLADGSVGTFAWPDAPRRNILLTANAGPPGAKRDGIDEATLVSLFEAEFCQPPGVDGVKLDRIL
jgi:hypothetical protein